MPTLPLADPGPSRAGARFGARAVLLLAALALVAVPFFLLLLLVEDKWRPLLEADDGARDSLHVYALAHPGFARAMQVLSDTGSPLAWQIILAGVVVWLLWRRLFRIAAFVAVTGIGSSVLNSLVKDAVHRARPVVSSPLVHEPGLSFPSGHAQAAIVGYAVLLLVFLPVLHGAWRRLVVSFAAVMVLAIGFSRIALAAHYVSDVLAGFILGAAWVAAMTAAFSVWRRERGRPPVEPSEGLAPEAASRIGP
ncbi:MAG TPA: phosphatase PAP2 family protein [Dermatophilaceae bacterium]|nr:phosphatase PAP2 family protein [Dermatophilaceae bacterium]